MAHLVTGAQVAPPARHEDVRLMELVAEGDPQARRMLALRLVTRVRRIARHLIATRADADDAAQIALVEILQSARTYRGEASVESWMSRIAARSILRHARKQRRWYDFAGAVREVREPSTPPPRLAGEELPRELEEYLRQLPKRHREVLVLKLGLDYTVEEISELLDLPPGTVKGRLVAARRKLRSLVQRDLNVRVGRGRSAP